VGKKSNLGYGKYWLILVLFCVLQWKHTAKNTFSAHSRVLAHGKEDAL
jgi:hypothetical protein